MTYSVLCFIWGQNCKNAVVKVLAAFLMLFLLVGHNAWHSRYAHHVSLTARLVNLCRTQVSMWWGRARGLLPTRRESFA